MCQLLGSSWAEVMAWRLLASSQYFNCCWDGVICTIKKKLQSNLNHITNTFCLENTFQNLNCENSHYLSRCWHTCTIDCNKRQWNSNQTTEIFIQKCIWICLQMPSILGADLRFVPSQWETALLCNDVSHWLGANLESALILFWPHCATANNVTMTHLLSQPSVDDGVSLSPCPQGP